MDENLLIKMCGFKHDQKLVVCSAAVVRFHRLHDWLLGLDEGSQEETSVHSKVHLEWRVGVPGLSNQGMT